MAVTASKGEWLFSTHLRKLDQTVTRFVLANQEGAPIPRILVIDSPPRHGKLCAHDTPVPTPDGWKRHGDILPGDFVFGPDGKPVEVLAIGPEALAGMRVTFSNGEQVECHEDHEWTVFDRSENHRDFITVETKWFTQTNYRGLPRKLIRACNNKQRVIYQLPLVHAIEYSEKQFQVDPYVLGAWLGDGSVGKPCITHDPSDITVVTAISKLYPQSTRCVHATTGVVTTYFAGDGNKGKGNECSLSRDLKAIGVFHEKRIPGGYLRGSIQQRLQLLAGLIDTDGHVETKTGRTRFVTTNLELRDGVYELATSLGFRPYVCEAPPTTSTSGIAGRLTVYTVGFQPTLQIPVKLDRKTVNRFAPQRRIGLISVDRIPKQEQKLGRCIQVASEDGLYLVGRTLIPTHNSLFISCYLPAWFRGTYPDKNVIITTYEASLAAEWGAKTRDIFFQSVDDRGTTVGDLFNVQIDPSAKRSNYWKFLGREGVTYTAGVRGPLTGRGGDLIIVDDACKNDEEALSPTMREKTWDWFLSTALTRLHPKGILAIIATRWHREDLTGRILTKAATGEFEPILHVHLPALTEADDPVPDSLQRPVGTPLWPERFPLRTLKQIKRSQSTFWWSALYQGRPTAADAVDWPDSYFHDHIWCDEDKWPNDFDLRIVFVDPAMGKTSKSGDNTAIVFAGVKGELIYVDAIAERMTSERVIASTMSFLDQYRPDLVGFEQNGFQQILAEQFEQDTRGHFGISYPIYMMTNTVNKILRIRRLDTHWRHQEFRLRRTPGCRTLVEEARDFPMGAHDDVLDGLESALRLPIEANFVKTR